MRTILRSKAKVEADGYPDALNVEGWNKQADVRAGLPNGRQGSLFAVTSTIRGHAKTFLAKVN